MQCIAPNNQVEFVPENENVWALLNQLIKCITTIGQIEGEKSPNWEVTEGHQNRVYMYIYSDKGDEISC